MTNRSGLLEKESVVFANKKTPVRTNYSNLNPVSAANIKLPAMDNLLEDTLVNIAPAEALTKRETQILKLIVAGKTNKKIAHEICRTERTVEYHRHRLMRKLDTNTAADLVKSAIAMGLV